MLGNERGDSISPAYIAADGTTSLTTYSPSEDGRLLAYGLSTANSEWFFPAMLLIIGGRYLTFGLLYGMRFYWGIGFALAGAGFATGMLVLQPALSAAAGAAIELVGAIVAFTLHGRSARTAAPA